MRALLTLLAALLLASCSSTSLRPADADPARPYWHGRLALRVESTPEPTSFSANFELTGQARTGELWLTTPLGTTVAELSWTPQTAQLRHKGEIRVYENLDRLVQEATGTPLPPTALFDWLQGRPTEAEGWQVDLSRLEEDGRLLARRQRPGPPAELRLVLERP